MNPRVRRLAVLAAMGMAGIVVPAAGASAAITPVAPGMLPLPAAGFPVTGGLPGVTGLPSGGLPAVTGLPAFTPGSFVGPSVGQVAAVIGPTIITTAPSTFINTNNQVSAGTAVSGGQAAP